MDAACAADAARAAAVQAGDGGAHPLNLGHEENEEPAEVGQKAPGEGREEGLRSLEDGLGDVHAKAVRHLRHVRCVGGHERRHEHLRSLLAIALRGGHTEAPLHKAENELKGSVTEWYSPVKGSRASRRVEICIRYCPLIKGTVGVDPMIYGDV